FFFFSSRRRHTRSKRDWSSDVCSSDLSVLLLEVVNPTTTLDTAWDSRLGSSMGLTGMRERVDLLGGVFEAGPVGGGHWRVHVVLPVQAGQKDEKNVEEEIERWIVSGWARGEGRGRARG